MKWTLMDPEEASTKSKSIYEIKTDLALLGNGTLAMLVSVSKFNFVCTSYVELTKQRSTLPATTTTHVPDDTLTSLNGKELYFLFFFNWP
jgi:hypothetical protein